MAIKITADSIVRVFRPGGYKFTLDELNDGVNGFIEPIKIGPLWVMYSEEAKTNGEPLNNVASYFFDIAIYGTVLVVPPHHLPSDWDLMEPEDYRYTADDIDSGFLMSLQQALMHKRVFGATDLAELKNDNETLFSRLKAKEEWTYKPQSDNDLDANTIDFYNQVYEYIVSNPDMIKKNILLSDDEIIVKIQSEEDKLTMINQMIHHYVSEEQYEKCSVLKTIVE
jgi:hypothetical protein